MKTLNQILEDEVISYLDFDIATEETEKEELRQDIINVFSKWLTQKLDQLETNEIIDASYYYEKDTIKTYIKEHLLEKIHDK